MTPRFRGVGQAGSAPFRSRNRGRAGDMPASCVGPARFLTIDGHCRDASDHQPRDSRYQIPTEPFPGRSSPATGQDRRRRHWWICPVDDVSSGGPPVGTGGETRLVDHPWCSGLGGDGRTPEGRPVRLRPLKDGNAHRRRCARTARPWRRDRAIAKRIHPLHADRPKTRPANHAGSCVTSPRGAPGHTTTLADPGSWRSEEQSGGVGKHSARTLALTVGATCCRTYGRRGLTASVPESAPRLDPPFGASRSTPWRSGI